MYGTRGEKGERWENGAHTNTHYMTGQQLSGWASLPSVNPHRAFSFWGMGEGGRVDKHLLPLPSIGCLILDIILGFCAWYQSEPSSQPYYSFLFILFSALVQKSTRARAGRERDRRGVFSFLIITYFHLIKIKQITHYYPCVFYTHAQSTQTPCRVFMILGRDKGAGGQPGMQKKLNWAKDLPSPTHVCKQKLATRSSCRIESHAHVSKKRTGAGVVGYAAS